MVSTDNIQTLLDGWTDILGSHQALKTNQSILSLLQESQKLIDQLSQGWQSIGSSQDDDLTIEKKHDAMRNARRAARNSPVIIAGIKAYQLLAHARGRTIKALDDDINLVIQQFLKANRKVIFSQQKKLKKERDLWTDANLFFRHFINPENGAVTIRFVDPLQIKEIITDPEDEESNWFYLRSYSHVELSGEITEKNIYYPDISFNPVDKASYESFLQKRYTLLGAGESAEVDWDTPIYHVEVNDGLTECYAALSWARCYEYLLQIVATVYQAISAISLVVKSKAEQVDFVAKELQGMRKRNQSGNAVSMDFNGDIKTLNAKSALMSSKDLDPFIRQVAMIFTLAPHMFGDQEPGGGLGSDQNRYEAMNLAIESRQNLWKEIETELINFSLLQAIKAGSLSKGSIREHTSNGLRHEEVEWGGKVNAGVNIVYPPVRKRDVKSTVDALIKVATMDGKQPLELITPRVLYQALAEVLPLGDVEAQLERIPEEWTADGSMIESPRMALRTLQRLVESLRSGDYDYDAL